MRFHYDSCQEKIRETRSQRISKSNKGIFNTTVGSEQPIASAIPLPEKVQSRRKN
jgi:hypothetical protein